MVPARIFSVAARMPSAAYPDGAAIGVFRVVGKLATIGVLAASAKQSRLALVPSTFLAVLAFESGSCV